jgi:hypothetical protein
VGGWVGVCVFVCVCACALLCMCVRARLCVCVENNKNVYSFCGDLKGNTWFETLTYNGIIILKLMLRN